MRRMISQKDIDYIDQLKGTIHNTPGNAIMVTIGNPDTGFVLNGTDGWIVGERLALGDPEGEFNAASISIDNLGKNSVITISAGGEEVAKFHNDGNGPVIELTTNAGLYLTDEDISLYAATRNVIVDSEGGNVSIGDNADNIIMPSLPTSNPGVEGALWNDNGVLKISSGN